MTGDVADFSWLRLFLAFFVVLAGLGGLGVGLRFVASRGLMLPVRGGRVRRLQIVESLMLDAKRRAVIISCDGREHLLLLNASRDIVVEANSASRQPPKKFMMRGLKFSSLAIAALAFALGVCAPSVVWAQSINFDMGGQGPSATAHMVQTIMLITVLSLAPSILVMVTSFTRIIVVLSFLRTALGTQTTPPNVVLISLAMFLTMFIMQPTFDQAWDNGVKPLMDNQIDEMTAFTRILEPFQDFMLKHTRAKDLDLFVEVSKANDAAADAAATKKNPTNKQQPLPAVPKASAAPGAPGAKADTPAVDDVPVRALIPAFMISELRRAFEIGFLLFMPFLIIDMVVASILMSMGMMMLPPSLISLPFKIVFFVLVDGWYLVCGSLIQSYGGG